VNAPWSTHALGDLFEIARGGSPRPIEKFITDDREGLNWVKIGDATASGRFIDRTKEKIRPEGLSKTRQVYRGDFLLTNSMSFGRPYIMATDGCIHDGWLLLRPRDDRLVDRGYFYHLLSSPSIYAQFTSRAAGATVKNLNTEIVSGVRVQLPPLEEQRRIAAILDKADALRQKRKRAIALLDGLPGSILASLVASHTESTFPLGDALTFVTSGGRNWSQYVFEIGPRFIRSFDVQLNSISDDEVVRVRPPQNAEARRTATKHGDVLLTITGSRIGRAAALRDDLAGSHVSQHVAILRPDQSQLLPRFLSAWLASRGGQAQIAKMQYGQTKPGLNFEQIRGFLLPKLTVEKQREFVSKCEVAWAVNDGLLRWSSKVDDLFASLQQRAFSGQL
jgi:type I restriction enzyme, S subunit